MQGGKPGNLPSVLQGLVLQCQDLESEVDFWTKGLGMKVLRRTRGSVVVGYGPESFALEKGGHVSLELVQASSAAASPAKVKPPGAKRRVVTSEKLPVSQTWRFCV